MRRLLSFVVTTVTFAVGLALLALGSFRLLSEPRLSAAVLPPTALALVLGGALLLALGAFTVRWSSSGLLLVGGAVMVAASIAMSTFDGPGQRVVQAVLELNRLVPDLGNGLVGMLGYGQLQLLGAAWFGVGLGARRPPRPKATGALAVTCALLAVAVLIGSQYAGRLTGLDLAAGTWTRTPQLAVIGAALLFGLLLIPSGRKTIGLWLSGGVAAAAGIGLLLFVDQITVLPPVALEVAWIIGRSGLLAALGLTLLGAALGATLRQRARNRSTLVA